MELYALPHFRLQVSGYVVSFFLCKEVCFSIKMVAQVEKVSEHFNTPLSPYWECTILNRCLSKMPITKMERAERRIICCREPQTQPPFLLVKKRNRGSYLTTLQTLLRVMGPVYRKAMWDMNCNKGKRNMEQLSEKGSLDVANNITFSVSHYPFGCPFPPRSLYWRYRELCTVYLLWVM